MKKLSLAVLVLFSAVFSAIAQPVDLPMIQSKAALKAYAIEQVARGDIFVSSPSVKEFDFDKQSNRLNRQGMSPGDLASKLVQKRFSLNLTRPESDQAWVSMSLLDRNWNAMVTAYQTFYFEELEEGYKIPSIEIVLQLADYIPLKVEGATSAYAEVFGQDGGYGDFERLNVYDGVVYFPSRFAGAQVELTVEGIVGGQSYSVIYAGAREGQQVMAQDVRGKFASAMISNYFEFSDEGLGAEAELETQAEAVVGYEEKNSAPVMRIKITSGRWVYVGMTVATGWGEFIEYPSSIGYYRSKENYLLESDLEMGTGWIYLDKGVWFIYFNTFTFEGWSEEDDDIVTPPLG